MIEQMYFTILKSLNVRLDYSSDNLFRIKEESQVEQYIGRANYLELRNIFNERLRKKYIKELKDLKLLDPVMLIGVLGSEQCYYLGKDNLLGVSDVHYLMTEDYKLYTVTKNNEEIIKSRVAKVGEYDRLLKGLLENSRIYENEYYGVGLGIDEEYGFDIKDEKQEHLLRVLSVQSVYKQYICYVMVVENSDGQVKTIPLQNFVKFE
jgi:hypothetical protein